MGKKIRLGNCSSCEGFVLVDIADDTITPLVDQCRHCDAPMDGSSVVDVPLIAGGPDEPIESDAAVCGDCGERWEDGDVVILLGELDGCPSCKPAVFGSLPADS